jgi:hypothetical protein
MFSMHDTLSALGQLQCNIGNIYYARRLRTKRALTVGDVLGALMRGRSVHLLVSRSHGDVIHSSLAPSSNIAPELQHHPQLDPRQHQTYTYITLSFNCTLVHARNPTMSFLRSFAVVRSAALKPAASLAPRAQFHTVRSLRQGDYGSGDGNPAGEHPQQQGKRGREDLEHPGPAPPKVGQGNKTSPNSDSFNSSSSGNSTSSDSSKSSSQDASSSSSSDAVATDKDVKNVKGAQPKILNESSPKEESEEVKQHNAEMEQRAEKAHGQVSKEDAQKDNVAKGFWSGESA